MFGRAGQFGKQRVIAKAVRLLRPVPSLDEIRKAREGTIARNLLNQFEPVAIGTLVTTRAMNLVRIGHNSRLQERGKRLSTGPFAALQRLPYRLPETAHFNRIDDIGRWPLFQCAMSPNWGELTVSTESFCSKIL